MNSNFCSVSEPHVILKVINSLCIFMYLHTKWFEIFIFMQVFEEEALTWEEKLNRINALFDVWIDVQRRWVYLEGIFSGSADIKVLLPVETSRFQSIR